MHRTYDSFRKSGKQVLIVRYSVNLYSYAYLTYAETQNNLYRSTNRICDTIEKRR